MNNNYRARSASIIDNEYKIAVLGAGAVGKSSLTIRYLHQDFSEEYSPTLQETFRKTDNIDGNPAHLEITDTAGQEDYIVMQDQWIRDAKGFVLVYAINKEDTLEEVKNIKKRIDKVKPQASIVIVGNKSDIVEGRKIAKSDGQAFANLGRNLFIETSAKTGDNCEEAFRALVRHMRSKEKSKISDIKKTKSFWDACTLI